MFKERFAISKKLCHDSCLANQENSAHPENHQQSLPLHLIPLEIQIGGLDCPCQLLDQSMIFKIITGMKVNTYILWGDLKDTLLSTRGGVNSQGMK